MTMLDLPSRKLRMHYVCNIKTELKNDYSSDWKPKSAPLDPAKPTIVFIHAPTALSQAYSAQFADPRLAQAYNLIAFDVRFHGETESLRTGEVDTEVCESMEELAEDVLAAIDVLQLTKYALVGEGFLGSNVCTWIATKRPNQAQALFLASPGNLEETKEVSRMMVHEWLPLACSNKDGKGDGTGALPEEALVIVNNFFFGEVGREKERRQGYHDHFQARYGPGIDAHDVERVVSFFLRKPIPPALRAAVTAPVLIIQGGDDVQVSPLSAAEDWRDGFKSARGGADVRIITGAPHLLMHTDYSIANRFLLAFLARSLSP